jgi:hypothetical protein
LENAFKDEKEGEYSITIEGVLNSDKSGNTVTDKIFDVYLDNTAPVIESVSEDEKNDTVTITASDNYGLYYAEVKGNKESGGSDDDEKIGEAEFKLIDGVYTATIDVSEFEDDYDIYVYDLAYNYATSADTETSAYFTVKEVEESYSGSIFNKTVKITNKSRESKTVTPILAVYDKDGNLLKTVTGTTRNFVGYDEVNNTFSVKLTEPAFPNLKLPDGAYTKLFLWNSVSGMEPIAFDYVTEE